MSAEKSIAELTAIVIHQASCLRQKDHTINEITTANAQVASANKELADEIRRQRDVIASLTPPPPPPPSLPVGDISDAANG